jgi:hypothetical protein
MTVDGAFQRDQDTEAARPEAVGDAVAPLGEVINHSTPQLADKDADPQRARILLEDPLVREYMRIRHEFEDYRQMALRNFSPWIVNHSSNIIGATQVTAEMAMLRASGTKTLKDLKRALLQDTKFTGGVEGVKSFLDLEKATELDKKLHGNRLINRWQARSTLLGLTTMGLTTLLPDDKDTQEDIDSAVKLQHESKLRYALNCLGKAINPLQWKDNKRHLAGLGLTLAGACSFLSGFRNVGSLVKGGEQMYVRNRAHSIGGGITALAGTQLLFALDNQRGWAQYGSTMWARMLFLPKSILNRYQRHDDSAHWYSGGQFGLQTANTMAFLMGGAQKRADGTVVDQKAMMREARDKALVAKAEQPPGKQGLWREEVSAEMPQTRIQKDDKAAIEHTPPASAVANQKANQKS